MKHFYTRHPFTVKEKEQQVTLVLFGVARCLIAEAKASAHAQISGKSAVLQYPTSSINLINVAWSLICGD